MKKTATIAASLLAAAFFNAFGEWSYVGRSTIGITYYIDYSTIRHQGGLVKVWEKSNYQTPRIEGWYSDRTQTQYDCANERYRLLHMTGFSKPDLIGAPIGSQNGTSAWEPVAPGTMSKVTFDAVCK